jgi:hypothetical protein
MTGNVDIGLFIFKDVAIIGKSCIKLTVLHMKRISRFIGYGDCLKYTLKSLYKIDSRSCSVICISEHHV